ncbi:beta-ketoacyl-[acyl-carrier-protein] synthase family protein [Virgibacillus sp.]|uniref:beta-ketoacyl-[acyl-carrier-protein] synthase family protein n=1 Tax=Virgibacillus sp. TaxID=1872700 RepID=UPI0017AF943D|nr:beta-ketoacyl-[acyl-carrier-protein] synthase family protein [Virgibacillus sp.]NWO15084.1 beta-ketoacyl-[acyl-carrier-protein] synthase family protein [Virgibacillus sp.]
MTGVAISGVGIISSIGDNCNETWQSLLAGKNGAGKVKKFSNTPLKEIYACEIENVDVLVNEDKEMGSATNLFYKTAKQALSDASLGFREPMKVGLSIGTTMGEIDSLESELFNKEESNVIGGPNVIADKVYHKLRLNGPKWTITNACAAGNIAISRAMEDILRGNADVMIAGGVDILSWVAFSGFNSLRALSPKLCTPFDRNRKGLLLGEGAGVLILESLEHLKKRKKGKRAVLYGYGLSSDGHHITQPDLKGDGAVKAMKDAIKMGNITENDIEYVNAHGTGTLANDQMENISINRVFNSSHPYVSSIKGHLGHTLGAASAIEAAVCVKILENGVIPHTQNLKEIDPKFSINLVKDNPISSDIKYVLSNSYAFGGVNSSILIGR